VSKIVIQKIVAALVSVINKTSNIDSRRQEFKLVALQCIM